MAKKSILQRQQKREKLTLKYEEKRSQLRKDLCLVQTLSEKQRLHQEFERLPRDSAKVRLRNRCWRTGRGRGFYQDFGLCRHMLQEMAHAGVLPGVYKASW